MKFLLINSCLLIHNFSPHARALLKRTLFQLILKNFGQTETEKEFILISSFQQAIRYILCLYEDRLATPCTDT